ncbi:MAG: aminopeptidase [Nanoarchaeota archaeon]|nr:aminopeptidase [Nanoarchaeota archaeon]
MIVLDTAKFVSKIPISVFENVIKNNLGITNEQLLIIGDRGLSNSHLLSPILTNAFSLAANNLGITHSTVYQTPKGRGESADIVMLKQLKNLPPKSTIIVNVSNRMGNMSYLGSSFRKFCKAQGHRFISTSSLGMVDNSLLPKLVQAFDTNAYEIQRAALRLKAVLDEAREIQVYTPAGTDLVVPIATRKALVASGVYTEPGTGGNAIPGEVYLAPDPQSVRGRLVIDGSIRTLSKTFLVKKPVECSVNRGDITSWNNTPESRLLRETISWAHKKAKNPTGLRRIGELGIGLNPQAKIIGTTIVDEKAAGTCHAAIGSNNWFGGDVKSMIHLDQVMKDPEFRVDGRFLRF